MDICGTNLRFWVLWRRRGLRRRCRLTFLMCLWTARRSKQSILKETSPEYSLEGLMLKLKLKYFGHLMRRTDSFEKTLMLGKIQGGRRRGQQRMRWLDGIADLVSLERTLCKTGPWLASGNLDFRKFPIISRTVMSGSLPKLFVHTLWFRLNISFPSGSLEFCMGSPEGASPNSTSRKPWARSL